MGKIRRERPALHHRAVRAPADRRESGPPGRESGPQTDPLPAADLQTRAFSFPKGIFAGTRISPESLVQTLKGDEPSPVGPSEPEPEGEEPKGREERKRQPKKEKMKERRQRWLNKVSAIKVAREQQVELERRRATPVVGDLRALADALPELTQILPRARPAQRERGSVKKKAEPTDFSRMKAAQKRKLLETEVSRFSEAMKDPSFRTNPLGAIGEHLRKRLRQEDEQS